MHIARLQARLSNLPAQYVLNDLTKIPEAFLLQYATILSTVHAYRNGQTLHAQFVGIVNSNRRNPCVLFVEL